MKYKIQPPSSVVIVGGGTAGWMAASWLNHVWKNESVNITLIESKDIGIIGVGEGSTPFMRNFFRSLNIPEKEWMPACNATIKAGISFPDWAAQGDNKNYFHPFFTHLDIQYGEAFFKNACLRRRGHDISAHPNDFFVTAALARASMTPIPKTPMQYEPDYAYHFDSILLGRYLRDRAVKLGVKHFVDTVTSVKVDDSGRILAIDTSEGLSLQGDFFIDCSGFSGLLIEKALHEPFISFKDNLFNDRAVAIPTPTEIDRSSIPVETVSAALSNGWAWKIPLVNRFGNGYVYSSSFLTEEQAELELRAHLGGAAAGQDSRHLKMRVGRITKHWKGNCLALGLSQGFIEPLEATAIMLMQFTIENFATSFENYSNVDDARASLNRKINIMFDGVRDYVVAHYHLNSRQDTEYWITNREHRNHSDALSQILAVWDEGGDFERKLSELRSTQVYVRPSWYCLLAGMGRFPESNKKLDAAAQNIAVVARSYIDRTAKENFISHTDYLKDIYGSLWESRFY